MIKMYLLVFDSFLRPIFFIVLLILFLFSIIIILINREIMLFENEKIYINNLFIYFIIIHG